MPRNLPPNVHCERSRHGTPRYYFRRGHERRIRLPDYGTPEFEEAHQACLQGARRPKPLPRGASGTFEWLIARYQDSGAYLRLSPATRRQRDNILKGVILKAGSVRYAAIRASHIRNGVEDRKATPAQARNFLDALRGLFRWALEAQLIKADPTVGVRNPPRRKSEGFKAWTVADVAAYEAKWPRGTRQRVWLRVLLYVGCRRGDAVVIGRQHVRDGVLSFTTEKGRDRDRIEVSRRIDQELQQALDDGPCADLAWICGERGEPLTKESFGNAFKAACRAAGITDKSAHGLRKLSATIWAERGATEHELMAMFGWLTPAMAALYTRAARRKLLALNAHDRLTKKQTGLA